MTKITAFMLAAVSSALLACSGGGSGSVFKPQALSTDPMPENDADFAGSEEDVPYGPEQDAVKSEGPMMNIVDTSQVGNPGGGTVDPECFDACVESGLPSDSCEGLCASDDNGNGDPCTIDGDQCAGCSTTDGGCEACMCSLDDAELCSPVCDVATTDSR